MRPARSISENYRGILYMVAACTGFIFNDTFVKLASEDIPVPQVIVIRSLVALPLVFAFCLQQGVLKNLAAVGDRFLWLRTLGEIGGTATYLTALARLEIANITAIAQTTPLAVTAAAALLMGEKVGIRRWSAIGIGFLAVVLIIRPGMAGFNAWSLLALCSIGFVVLRDLSTRAMPLHIHPLIVTLISLATLIPLGLAMTPFEPWQALSLRALAYCIGSALTLSVSYVLVVKAMRHGLISVVAPFRYVFLIWAILIQVVVFAVWPDALTLLGSAILVATGLYTLYRERVVRGGGVPAAARTRAPHAQACHAMTGFHRTLQGITAIVVSQFVFLLNDTLIKLTSEALPTGEIIFLRGVFCAILVGAVAVWLGLHRIAARVFHAMVVWRLVGELGGTLSYLIALFHMPIANATIIFQAVPLSATAGAALFLGEAVGWRRWVAIAVGFAGVVLVIRPGLAGFDAFGLAVLVSVLFVTLRDLSTRAMPTAIPTLPVTLAMAIAVSIMGLVLGFTEDWLWPRWSDFGRLAGASLFVAIGYFTAIAAMRLGTISVTAPFRYVAVVFAIALGFFVWGDVPDRLTLIGSAVIVGAGLYTLYRERRLAEAPVAAVAATTPAQT